MAHCLALRSCDPVSPPGHLGGHGLVPSVADFLLHSLDFFLHSPVEPSLPAPACNPKHPVWNGAQLVHLRWDRCQEDLRVVSSRANLLMYRLSLFHCSWQPPGNKPKSTTRCPATARAGCDRSPTVRHPILHTLGTPTLCQVNRRC